MLQRNNITKKRFKFNRLTPNCSKVLILKVYLVLYCTNCIIKVIKLRANRIYYVPPRLVGSVASWSGKDAPDGASWLVDHAKSMNFNSIWLSPFFETTQLKAAVPEGHPADNSLYATRNHGVFDPEFSATKIAGARTGETSETLATIDALDSAHLKHFTAEAGKAGIRVMADLVFNQFAADHPLVQDENAKLAAILKTLPTGEKPALLTAETTTLTGGKDTEVVGISYKDNGVQKEFYFKFARDEDLNCLDWRLVKGNETAQINFASPAAREFFIDGTDGKPGFLKGVMDWYLDHGFKDFRCDIAYRLPADWWQELITHARGRLPDAGFMAETLGAPDAAMKKMTQIKTVDANGVERPGFDLGMVSNYWWNFTDDWLPQGEAARLRDMAKFGGAASPDNHDTPETLAGQFQKACKGKDKCDENVAAIAVRNYAVSTFIANAVYMQMGYEYNKEKQNGVFKDQVTTQDWADLAVRADDPSHPLNIAARIKGINDLKESLGVENCVARVKEHTAMQDGRLIKIAVEFQDADTGRKTADVVMILNKKPENGSVTILDSALRDLETGPLKRLDSSGETAVSVRDVVIYHTPVSDAVAPKPASVPSPRIFKPAA